MALNKATDVSKNYRGAKFVTKDKPAVGVKGAVQKKGLFGGGMGRLRRSPVAEAATEAAKAGAAGGIGGAVKSAVKGMQAGKMMTREINMKKMINKMPMRKKIRTSTGYMMK